MPARLIRRRLGKGIWRSYFKFCVVRNPFEKAISAFYFAKARDENGRAREGVPWSDQDPQLFEKWLETSAVPQDRNTFCIAGRFALDDVIRHETLAPDVERICGRLGLPWEPERLPAFKAGIRPREATAGRLYTARARQLVSEAYRFELRHFGYTFPAAGGSAPSEAIDAVTGGES
jgi:hypothetical protein